MPEPKKTEEGVTQEDPDEFKPEAEISYTLTLRKLRARRR